MRFVNVRELKSKTSEILRAAAGEDIIVTNHGKPVAVVAGIDGRDFEKIGFRSGASRVREAHAGYRMEAVDYEKPEAGKPAPVTVPAEKAAGNPLKAVFWDYPELTEEKGVREYVEVARRSPDHGALDWVLTRFLERGRVVDARKYFDWAEIRSALPHLRLTPYARKKWARMLDVYART
jgi:prevent-host-death family protein